MKKTLFIFLAIFLSTTLAASELDCVVDSSGYSQYPKEGYQVPLMDGVNLQIKLNGESLESVSIEGENFFSRCYSEMHEIKTLDEAQNVFQYTGAKEFERFLGYKAGFCKTVDEGWMVLVGESDGYLAYMGPYEVVLSAVMLRCK